MDARHSLGFSLIELLTTLTLLLIFASAALPSYQQFSERNRLQALMEELQAHVRFARTSSVLNKRPVDLCGSSDGNQCDNQWNRGWRVAFADSQETLRAYQLTSSDRLDWRGMSSKIRFRDNGTAPMSNGRFYLCDADDALGWQLVLSRQGRLRRIQGLEDGQEWNGHCD